MRFPIIIFLLIFFIVACICMSNAQSKADFPNVSGKSTDKKVEKIKIVVLDFEPRGRISDDYGLIHSEKIRNEFAKTGVFDLADHIASADLTQTVPRSNMNREEYVKKVAEFLKENNLTVDRVVMGHISGTPQNLFLTTYFVDSRTGETLSTGSLKANSLDNLQARIPELVYNIARDQYAGEAIYTFFKSVFVPGWGQWSTGHKFKAIAFPAAILGTLALQKALPGGDPYVGGGKLWIKWRGGEWGQAGQIVHPVAEAYYIGSKKVSKEEYYAEASRRAEVAASQKQANQKKQIVKGLTAAIYLANIIDAIFVSKKYDIPDELERYRLSIKCESAPHCFGFKLAFSYHF